MALILTGILGETKGKVGPVIAQTWKGKNYIRSYRKPIDRKSEEQELRRNLMIFVNDIGKYNYQTIIKPAMTGACVGEQFSPWNLFYKLNSGDVNSPNAPVNLKISYGTAPQLQPYNLLTYTSNNTVKAYWSAEVPAGCSSDDLIYAYILDTDGKTLVRFSPEGVKRSAGVFTVNVSSAYNYNNRHLYFFTHNVDGSFSPTFGKIIMISGGL